MGGDWLTVAVPKSTEPDPAVAPASGTAPAEEQVADDLTALSYEEARDELVAVVARLEAGGASLEESLALWERGEALAARCQQWLDGARERLSSAQSQDRPAGSPDDADSDR